MILARVVQLNVLTTRVAHVIETETEPRRVDMIIPQTMMEDAQSVVLCVLIVMRLGVCQANRIIQPVVLREADNALRSNICFNCH